MSTTITKRTFVGGGIGLTMASAVPFSGIRRAFAAEEDDRIVAAAKPLGAADIRGMIWSNYYVPMTPAMQEFKQLTGIGVGSIQDISIFDAPQRAMAEALSRSPQFDFFHIDSNMIPSLASAGLLEPLDEYMKKANFKIDAVGDYANFMTYKGNTYGVITDGNVHIQYLRKDLMEDADNQKRFEDKFGKKLAFPQTWEDELRIQQFFHNPEKDITGSGSLRNRANGATWWYMMFYSAGGFPFDDDVNPTINTEAGNYAVDTYLQEKKVGASGIGRLGHAADDPAHRQRQGRPPASTGTAPCASTRTRRSRRPSASGCTAWCQARTSPASGSTARSLRRSPRCW